MRFVRCWLFACFLTSSCGWINALQATSLPVVPRLVNFSGKAIDARGKVINGVAGATFAIYKDQFEGTPLWIETQNIQADPKGNYTVQLGTTKPDGLPLDLFSSGEARWLGVTINGGQEQPRVLLLSVPYALKAADAETVGGLPASAFALKQAATESRPNPAPAPASTKNNVTPNSTVTGKGVVDYIPMWDKTSDIIDSIMFQKSSKIGVNTTSPAATFDVNGKTDVRDTLTLFPKGTDSTLSINGTSFKIDQTGKLTFVSGQTFPGTGTGTVTSVGLSAPTSDFTVSGSPITGNGTLNLNWTVAPTNVDTANAIVKRDSSGSFSAGTITSGNINALGTITAAFQINGASASSSGAAVIGTNTSASGFGATGVLGVNGGGNSSELQSAAAVEGDTGLVGGSGVTGTADDGFGGAFLNNSPSGFYTLEALAYSTNSFPFLAINLGNPLQPNCNVDNSGNLNCTGTKHAIVPIDGGKRKVALSAIESPQNWFEDFGSAQLINGVAVVHLDPDFIQTVNTEMDYKVFPVPNADCRGLYVTNKTPRSFEVHELGGGTSSISFDYRITAIRRKYENVRFEDHTNDPDPKRMLEMKRLRSAAPSPATNSASPLIPVTQLAGR